MPCKFPNPRIDAEYQHVLGISIQLKLLKFQIFLLRRSDWFYRYIDLCGKVCSFRQRICVHFDFDFYDLLKVK